MTTLTLRAAGLSDQGRMRANNEDAFFCDPAARLFLVADGLGGHAGGEVASALVAGAAAAAAAAVSNAPDPGRELATLLRRADAEVRARAAGDLSGMASTAVALSLRNSDAWVAHAGDSRAYRLRGGSLRRLTRDHTPEAELGAELPIRSGMITRALGIGAGCDCELTRETAAPADRFLLCSDGLTDCLDDAAIANLLAAPGEPADIARDLVAAANAAGGRDNITVIVILVG